MAERSVTCRTRSWRPSVGCFDGVETRAEQRLHSNCGTTEQQTHEAGVYQRKRQVPQVSPAPKPLINKVSPRLSRPAFRASSRAMGIEPADVLP